MVSAISSDPASAYADWPMPNYVDPVRRAWMPAFALTWQVASTILVAGRFYLRARKQAGSFGLDDLLISIGWLFSVGFTVTTLLDTERYNVDRHVWDVKPSVGVDAALDGFIGQIMFILSTVPTKLSVLLFYRRMAKDSLSRRWMWAIYSALFITSGYGISCLVTYLVACRPLEALWMAFSASYAEEYTCIDSSSFIVASGIMSAVSDCYAVAIPFGMLRKCNLDVPRRQWIALHITFASGFLVTGAGIGRTYYIWRSSHTIDSSWAGFDLLAWSVVECQLAIVCACAPSLRAFFRHYLRDPLKRTFDTFSSVSYHPGGSQSSRGLEEGGGKGIELEIGMCCRGRQPERTSELTEREKITTPQEYEAYAVERLSRHGSRARSLMSVRTQIVEFDMLSDSTAANGGKGRADAVDGFENVNAV